MRKLLRVSMVLVLGLPLLSMAQQRTCAAHEKFEEQIQNPKYQHRMEMIEESTADYVRELEDLRATGRLDPDGETVIIPVVVHVIYKTSQQNISDAQIQSQIDVLNEDFSATNSDYSNTPSEFASVASGDLKIRFEMATVDPNGNATTGITRKYSNTSSWGTNDAMKSSSSGGVDAWPTDEYLNMWVCNIGGGILGYAQFPGGDPSTDGVVMSPNYFGSSDKGTGFYLSAPFDKGRTTTHEVGHWLNLRHIWGDGACGASDYVSDTPDALQANYGCPSHPSSSCLSNDMFMNYMDYVDDACMNMFTQGQEDRMRAVFFGTNAPRASFIATGGGGGGGGSCSDTEVTLTLTTDNYPGETSWELKNGSGTVIESGSGYSGKNTTYTETFCLGDGDYEYIIYDSYGDGICCSYGSGSYDLSDASTSYASGGSFGSSEATSFTIGSGGGGGGGGTPPPAPTGYCASQGNNTNDEYINRVVIGSIDNTSGNDGGYGDYTHLNTSLQANNSYGITIYPTWTGTVYREAYDVWIDYNRDGDFTDAGENVYSRSRTTSSVINGSFTVPSSFSDGYTRMRVSMKYNANPSSCETFTYGEVEDYEVLLGSGARFEGDDLTEGIRLFPNPATNHAQVEIVSNQAGPVELRVVNIQGSTQFIDQVSLAKGKNLHALDLSEFSPGVYFISVQTSQGLQTKKLIVQ